MYKCISPNATWPSAGTVLTPKTFCSSFVGSAWFCIHSGDNIRKGDFCYARSCLHVWWWGVLPQCIIYNLSWSQNFKGTDPTCEISPHMSLSCIMSPQREHNRHCDKAVVSNERENQVIGDMKWHLRRTKNAWNKYTIKLKDSWCADCSCNKLQILI